MSEAAGTTAIQPTARSAAATGYVLFLLFLFYMFNFVDRQVVNILSEPIKRELHISDTELGVLNGPAFALLCVAASYGLAFVLQRPIAHRIGAACIGLLFVESLPKTLVLPENSYRSSPRDWWSSAQQIQSLADARDRELLAKMAPLAGRQRIVSDYVGAPRLLAKIGCEVVPLWSPDVAWLFDEKLDPAEAARRWRQAGLRYLVLLKIGPTAGFMQQRARWRAPYFTLKTVAELDTLVVLEATATADPTK